MFLQHQGTKIVQNTNIYCFFSDCVENAVFCNVFSTVGLKCIVNINVFFLFLTSSSQSKPTKNVGICSVVTRQNAKTNGILEQFLAFFSSCSSIQKLINHFVLPFLPRFIRTQEGIKSKKIVHILFVPISAAKFQPEKLEEPVWAQKCCKLQCFVNVPGVFPA